MPRATGGECRKLAAGYQARIRLAGERVPFMLAAVSSDTEAEARTHAMADIAARLTKAGHGDRARNILEEAARATARGWPSVVSLVEGILGGRWEPAPVPSEQKPITFGEVARRWTSGELAREFPQYVSKKKTADEDASRLALLNKENRRRPDQGLPPRRREASDPRARLEALAGEPASLCAGHLPRLRACRMAARIDPGEPDPSELPPQAGRAEGAPVRLSERRRDAHGRDRRPAPFPRARGIPRSHGVPEERVHRRRGRGRRGWRRGSGRGDPPLTWDRVDLERGVVRLERTKTESVAPSAPADSSQTASF